MTEIEDVIVPCDCENPCKVFWYGYSNWSGYGRVTKHSVSALRSLGLKIKSMPHLDGAVGDVLNRHLPSALKDAVRVAHLMPNRRVPRGKYNVRFTVWEASRIPPDWVDLLNQEDEVWVPSGFCKEVFKDSGVTKPIQVIPHAVNIDEFNPKSKNPLFPDERFTFLWIGDNLPRKGLDVFIQAFKEEFSRSEPVRALVRIYSLAVITGNGPTRTMLIQLASQRWRAFAENITSKVKSKSFLNQAYLSEGIQIVSEKLPSSSMPGLYHSAQCYVMSSRGEGFGLCGLEALACGIPVIYTNWSGQTEFLNKNNAYPVAYKLVPVKNMPADYEPLIGKAKWAEPDQKDLQRAMREVYEDYQTALEKAKAGVKLVENNYTWSHIANRMMERLDEV